MRGLRGPAAVGGSSKLKLRSLIALSLALAAPAYAQEKPALGQGPAIGPTPVLSGADLSRFLPAEAASAEDGRRTLGALPRNLGRSFVGVFSKENLAPLLIGAAATGMAAPFDQPAQTSLVGQAPEISRAASTAGGFSVIVPATLGLFVAGRFSHDSGFRAFSYDAGQAMLVTGVYTGILKKAVSRQRPDGSDTLSFPSGHSSTAFALATVADRHYGWKVAVPSYLAASAIALSRISNNKHHLTDILAGATIGVISARTVVRVNGETRGRQRRFALGPMTDPQGGGVGVGASLSW
jgi:membrane-associated phospholipid phosphatase